MSKENSGAEETLDCFWLRDVYPDASATLAFSQTPLAEIKGTCMVALDANVLLLPYRLGATSLDEIKKLFADLAKANRIFLPAQAVREFLKHRANKIRDVLRELGNQASQIQVVADRKVGFLEADPGYQELVELSQKIKELKAASLKTISQIGDRLRNGVGADPVTTAYREIFVDRVVDLDADIEDEAIKSEMAWRYRHSIPPGYKDRNKPDEGIGDFVIWKTILQLAAKTKLDCIFVTEDAKSDWWVQSEGIFQPRLELVEEYRRASGGKTLHLLPLSGLLELLGAQIGTIDEAREAEIARKQRLIEVAEQARRRYVQTKGQVLSFEEEEPDYTTYDRTALTVEINRLRNETQANFREKLRIDQILRDAEAMASLSDAEVAQLFRQRDEQEIVQRTLHRRRRRAEEQLKSSVMASE